MKRRILMSILLGMAGSVAMLCSGCAHSKPPASPAPGLAATPGSYPPYDGLKKRLAVVRMENKVRTPIPDASWNIGDGLTEMLISELFKTSRFIMVERSALADVVKEQELGQTGLVRKETAAKVGEVLGAQLLVAGAVTEFEAKSGGGGGGVGFSGLNLAMKTSSAHVGVDIRLVDASTGQILKSYNANASAQETGFGFGATVKGVSFGSDAFMKTPLGEATREAIFKAVMFIVGEMERVPWSGRVVQVKEGSVYVNAGANVNLRPGMRLAAFCKGEDLVDPATGLILGSKDDFAGMVTLMQIEEKFSVGMFVGNGALKRGDILKMQ